jgi:molecular chaperone GrpE
MSDPKNEKVTEEQAANEQEISAEQVDEQNFRYQELKAAELRELLIARDKEVESLQQELDEVKNSHLRKAAEFENYRKRVQRERSQLYETAKANAVEDFLHVNDDLQRILKAAEDLEVNETFMDGVLLVANKFDEVLKKNGVERIDKEGVPFNVDFHDAMMRQKPKDDNVDSNVVLDVIENGYRMGDRIIRHAKVIVSE